MPFTSAATTSESSTRPAATTDSLTSLPATTTKSLTIVAAFPVPSTNPAASQSLTSLPAILESLTSLAVTPTPSTSTAATTQSLANLVTIPESLTNPAATRKKRGGGLAGCYLVTIGYSNVISLAAELRLRKHPKLAPLLTVGQLSDNVPITRCTLVPVTFEVNEVSKGILLSGGRPWLRF